MSWLYSRALVEASSAGILSDGVLSAPSSSTPTLEAYSSHAKTTERLPRSLSGTTFGRLTDERGEALLTSFLEAFRAKTYRRREAGKVSKTEKEADCGEKWHASLGKYDLASCSWKTFPLSLGEGSESCSVTWPRWGLMRGGESWALATPELHTDETACGSSPKLPTPTATSYGSTNNGTRPSGETYKTKGTPSLATMAAKNLWPTPTAGDSKSSGSRMCQGSKAHAGLSLTDAVQQTSGKERDGSPTGGRLNPTWVEWLMGWPLGWTASAALETGRFQQWLDSHGK